MHNKCNNIFTKQYLLLLLAMDSTFYFIHFISFNAGFNPIHQFYDPRIGLNSQFGKHCPHSGFLWSTSPGAWFIGWIVGSIPKIRKQFHTCLFFFSLKMDSFQNKKKSRLSRCCLYYEIKINPFRQSTNFYSQLYLFSV